MVKSEDGARAKDVLSADAAIDEREDVDFGDATETEAGVPAGEIATDLPDDLVRAWRSAVIGLFLLPPLLNIHSTRILVRNKLFIGRCRNWRVAAACAANLAAFTFVIWLVSLIVRPQEPYFRGDDEEPIPARKRFVVIPLVPYESIHERDVPTRE